ncbi:unnamed protein product [Polarella glacialis]|uniref:Uncharacterized protein n=1 Tax=Polarella glacialis TaxID=89957 RepID=A0A813DKK4_POLGL|nr:unnamed protein product [Polarella glacialis]
MARRTNTQRAVCFAAAAAALASVSVPLFAGGGGFLADGAQSRAPAQAALRSRFQADEFQAQFEEEEPVQGASSFASSFRAFGCAAVLAVAVLAQGGVAANAQEREGIPSGNAKGDPNLTLESMLPNPGGKSLLSELNDPTFGKVAYDETPAEKRFKTRKSGKYTQTEAQKAEEAQKAAISGKKQ